MTARAFRGPGRYRQGPDVLATAADHLATIDATAALVAGGTTALEAAGDDLEAALAASDIATRRAEGVVACTTDQVAALTDRIDDEGCDLVVGVGGGAAIDAAKAAASRADTAFVSVPTVASTDAPASSIAVLYDDDGRVMGVEFRDRCPELVLADTSLLSAAPASFLRYGLGDALATRFEAEACMESGGSTLQETAPADSGLALARRTHGTIVECGVEALDAAGTGEPSPAFERAVEAVLLQSALGFENGGLAAAHALEIGFRTAGVTEPAHGLLVGVCTLAQLHLEDNPAYDSVANLLADLGLAVPLADLGVDDETLEQVGTFACADLTTMDNEPGTITPADAVAALQAASADLADR